MGSLVNYVVLTTLAARSKYASVTNTADTSDANTTTAYGVKRHFGQRRNECRIAMLPIFPLSGVHNKLSVCW